MKALGCGAIILLIVIVCGIAIAGSYNRLVGLQQNVDAKWAQVQNVYQRRADLIPNLVNTVAGAANFEKSTLEAVTNARASVGRVQLDPNKAPTDAAQLQQFQEAQGQLSNALSRLLVVSERYPELKANQNFQQLQAQLEGTENRISVERGNFNEAVQSYNVAVRTFPTNLFAGMLGFLPRPFFNAQPGAEKAPNGELQFRKYANSCTRGDAIRYLRSRRKNESANETRPITSGERTRLACWRRRPRRREFSPNVVLSERISARRRNRHARARALPGNTHRDRARFYCQRDIRRRSHAAKASGLLQ